MFNFPNGLGAAPIVQPAGGLGPSAMPMRPPQRPMMPMMPAQQMQPNIMQRNFGLASQAANNVGPLLHAANGGAMMGPSPPPGVNLANMVTGALKSPVAGRTDHLPISVPPGSYVVPADVVSAIGQGNTENGTKVLQRMFVPAIAPNPQARGVDIMAAGGEYVIPPDVVAQIGHGNMKQGHAILDSWVKKTRAANIQHLKKIPGPVRT